MNTKIFALLVFCVSCTPPVQPPTPSERLASKVREVSGDVSRGVENLYRVGKKLGNLAVDAVEVATDKAQEALDRVKEEDEE